MSSASGPTLQPGVRQRVSGTTALLLAFSLTSPLAAATDLLGVLQLAEQQDARWAAARATREAGLEKREQAKALFMPTLSLSGSYQRNHSDVDYKGSTPFTEGENRYDNGEYGANLSYPLFRAQNTAQYHQLHAQTDLAERQYAQARQDFLLRVAQGYFDVLAAQDSLGLTDSEIRALQEQLQQAEARLGAGAGTITDAHDARSRLALAQARRVAAEKDLRVRQQSLVRITGVTPGPLAGLDGETQLPAAEPAQLEPWLARAQASNPAALVYEESLRVAKFEVDRARGAHYPTLDAVAAYSRNQATGSIYTQTASETRISRAGLEVQVPLFQGGASSSRIREAIANHEQARAERDDANRQIDVFTHDAFLSVQHGQALISSLKEAVFAAEQLLDSATLGLRAGLRARSDVLDAEQRLYSARRDLSRARYDYLLNLLKLESAGGDLEDDDLKRVNRLLQPPMASAAVSRATE